MDELTSIQLSALMPRATPAIIARYLGTIVRQTNLAQINTPLRMAHWLAQIGHETGDMTVAEENLNYSAEGLIKTWPTLFNAGNVSMYAHNPKLIANRAYGGRYGNTAPDDGWKYRGRGFLQTTFKGNYLAFEKATGLKVVDNPDVVAVDPHICVRTSTYFWESHNLNAIADVDDIVHLRRITNGGAIGLEDCKARLARAKSILGVAA